MTGSLSQTRGRPEPWRELDALIATRIFGWESAGEKQMWSLAEDGGEAEPDGTEWMGQLPPELRTHPEQHLFLPCYSTDIAAAWTVVEKMREIGWHFDVGTHLDGWVATFTAKTLRKFQRKPDGGAGNSHTAPHAICLAALAALSPADDGGAR